jgi:hypothetical protein
VDTPTPDRRPESGHQETAVPIARRLAHRTRLFPCGGGAHAKTSGCQWSAGSIRGSSFGLASRASSRSSSVNKAIAASSRHWRRGGTSTTITPSTTPKAAAVQSRAGIVCATRCGSISSAIRVTGGTRPMRSLMPPHSARSPLAAIPLPLNCLVPMCSCSAAIRSIQVQAARSISAG